MPRHRKPKVNKAGQISAGILLWRRRGGRIEVLLGHPGGPYFSRKDDGDWTVLKGEVEPGEELVAVARREFEEESGHRLDDQATLIDLGDIRQKSGKLVVAWAVEGDLDPAAAVSNTFEMEWPPHSGTIETFPEIDRVGWFTGQEARTKLKGAQAPFLDRLDRALRTAESG
jgi:predicted NUDIX family NTP pyrophosphohydrolase